jgi:hemolysin D
MSTTELRHPTLELLARYKAIFKAAWEARRELAGPRRLADEQAFLPAALSLQETPTHPAPRRAAIVICTLFLIALLWSLFGKVDIVAVAQGRVVVSERTKTIQSLEAGVVAKILVRDGDSVKAGQVLVELDATNAQADQANVSEQHKAAESEWQRSSALLDALRVSRAPVLPPLPPGEGRGEGRNASHTAQLQAEWQDITARIAKLDAEQTRRGAEAATVREAIAKLEATIPLAQQREADVKGLADQGFMNQHAGQDRTRERIELERDLALQKARLAEAQAAQAESQQSKAALLAETRRALRERQATAQLKRDQLTQEGRKSDQRERLTQLTAPVDGTVQQLAIHTTGGVVTPAQVLMVVVPQGAAVTAEVVLENKDIGFVSAGQAAEIKLETFPFTRYGTVHATVKSVSADAVADDKRGAIFPATLQLQDTQLSVEGKKIALAPGMNLTAEIKTGKRRVIDYLLSPVQTATQESLRER